MDRKTYAFICANTFVVGRYVVVQWIEMGSVIKWCRFPFLSAILSFCLEIIHSADLFSSISYVAKINHAFSTHFFFSCCCGPILVDFNPMAYTSLQRNSFNVGQASIEPKIDIWISRCPLLPIVFIYAKNLTEMCMCQKRKRKKTTVVVLIVTDVDSGGRFSYFCSSICFVFFEKALLLEHLKQNNTK